SRFSSQNLSLMYSALLMFSGAVARFGSTFLSISGVEAFVVGPYGIFGGRFFWFCGSLTKTRYLYASSLFGVPFMITHESILYRLFVHTILKFFLSWSLAAAIGPLYASVIATSPEARSCGGCEPFSHQTRFALSWSSFLKARSTPAGVPSVL